MSSHIHNPFAFASASSRNPMRIGSALVDNMRLARQSITPEDARRMFAPARTLGMPENTHIAMDAALAGAGVYDLISHSSCMGADFGPAGQGFLGYAYLAMLTQNGLIRAGVQTVADEMTRKWAEIKGADTGDDDRIKQLTQDMERFNAQAVFNTAASHVGYFGGCLVYIDVGPLTPEQALEPLTLDPTTFARGSLRRFTPVEPINVFPGRYNSANPLDTHYFQPKTWFVLGREYHASRFLYFSSGELPLLLRPAYNFFGLSMSQLALDYVAHFTETREAAARLLTKFSLVGFGTNLSGILSGGGSGDLDARMDYFVQKMSNDGAFVFDKETEELVKLDTSLSGVIDIPRQALELLAAVFRVPAVKLLGISPAGFNSTGEGDLRNFYDHAASQQQKILRPNLNKTLDILQINAFGQVDPSISIDFIKPGDDDPKYVAELNKIKADTDAVLFDRGIVSAEEVRARLAASADSGYSGIDVDDVPEVSGASLGDINNADEAGRVW